MIYKAEIWLQAYAWKFKPEQLIKKNSLKAMVNITNKPDFSKALYNNKVIVDCG